MADPEERGNRNRDQKYQKQFSCQTHSRTCNYYAVNRCTHEVPCVSLAVYFLSAQDRFNIKRWLATPVFRGGRYYEGWPGPQWPRHSPGCWPLPQLPVRLQIPRQGLRLRTTSFSTTSSV